MALLAQDLREAVLKAAIYGELTEHNINDNSVGILLKKIDDYHKVLLNNKVIKNNEYKSSSAICKSSNAIPCNWLLVKLGRIIQLISGQDLIPKNYNSLGEGVVYITGASNFQNGEIIINRWTDNPSRLAIEGDVLVTCKGTIGEVAVLKIQEAHIARQVMALRSTYINHDYIKLLITYYVDELKRNAKSLIPGIERSDILNMDVPLPPIEEQQRIVERVEELMSKIDEYEKIENKLETLKKSFPEDMKASLLQAAMQGKLTEQLTTDTFVEVGEEIPNEEIPFDIPKSWKWTYLNNIATINGGFAFKSSKYSQNGVRVIRISDFTEDGFNDSNIVRYDYTDDLEQYIIENKNILLCMTGGTVGKSLFVENVPEKMLSNQRVATIKIDGALPEYVYKAILSPFIQQMIDDSKNSTNDNISMTLIKNFPIPVPPIEEQERMVFKIDKVLLSI